MTITQKRVLVVAILASFVAFLDGSVINVALPAISKDLGSGLTLQQWVVDAYLITLGSLILVAGSLSDLFGRKKVLAAGLWGFGIASIMCAVSPSDTFLIISRGLQGVAGALLVPSSLAMIISAFSGAKQGKAIGTWTAWTGMAFLVGPLLGGALVDAGSWRWIFAINVIPIAITLGLIRSVQLKEQLGAKPHVDIVGAVLCVIGLGGPVYSLIEQSHYGWSSPLIYIPLLVGIAAFGSFLMYERQTPEPMLPLPLFKVRNFLFGNLATIAIYAGLSVATFLIAVFVQQIGGYTAMQAGLSLMPVTLIMFVLSPRFGALAGKFGPRIFMTVGPIVAAIGFLSMLMVDESVAYWSQLLPGVLIFGLGLSMTVAPLTSAVLGSIDPGHAGVGSAVNNALARIAGLVAIACLGVITGPNLSIDGFHHGIAAMAVLLALGGIVSAIGIRTVVSKNPIH
jgi:EmrB/QacA subfamily drug resistance transporter